METHRILSVLRKPYLRVDRFSDCGRFGLSVIMARHQGLPHGRLAATGRSQNHHAESECQERGSGERRGGGAHLLSEGHCFSNPPCTLDSSSGLPTA